MPALIGGFGKKKKKIQIYTTLISSNTKNNLNLLHNKLGPFNKNKFSTYSKRSYFTRNKRFYSTRDKKIKFIGTPQKELFIKFFLFITVFLLFTFPLKYLCKLCGAPYLVSLVLSGMIGCLNTILYYMINTNNINISSIEFIRIFFMNICVSFFTLVVGYFFFLVYFVSGLDVLSIIPKTINKLCKIFITKPLIIDGNESLNEITDKPSLRAENTLSKGQTLKMECKGESSNSSSVNVSNQKGESSNSSSINVSNQKGELSNSNYLDSNNYRKLPDPYLSKFYGYLDKKFQIALV